MKLALYLLLLALPSSGMDAPVPDASALAGAWSGAAVHNGESQPVGLTLEPAADGTLSAKLSVPALGLWDLPLPPAKPEPGGVRIGQTFVLRFDAADGALYGPLPAALVPVYSIPLTLRRGLLARTTPAPPGGAVASPLWTFDARAPVWAGAAGSGARPCTSAETTAACTRWTPAPAPNAGCSAPAGPSAPGPP